MCFIELSPHRILFQTATAAKGGAASWILGIEAGAIVVLKNQFQVPKLVFSTLKLLVPKKQFQVPKLVFRH